MKKGQATELDFGHGDIGELFRKMFFPTLMGMVSMVVLNLADGAFIGHGAGTEALAAINIAAPIFNLMIGIGLLFGIGVSVVASIQLSHGEIRAARMNTTQAMFGSLALTCFLGGMILLNLDTTCRIFGSSEALVPLAGSYLKWVAAFLPFCILGNVGSFVIRLDGSPNYAMACTLTASALNIVLDYIFVFPLQMGLEGAAIATSISFSISALMVIYYLVFKARTMKLCRMKFTLSSMAGACANLWAQVKAGFPSMLGELAVSFTVILGNFVFIHYLGEDGVAAFGVACYCMPVVFMFSSAIVEAIQPIISFAHGIGDTERVRRGRNMALKMSAYTGVVSSLILIFGAKLVTLIFIPEGEKAFDLTVEGMPYYGIAGLLCSINAVIVGYLQSVERSRMATWYSLVRGFIAVVPAFILLPVIFGETATGIWLAIPVAEAVALVIFGPLALAGSTQDPEATSHPDDRAE